MQQNELFTILDTVESTNNYAMAKIHEGLAIHGQAWFTKEQTAGKGQRGKEWKSEAEKNIIMSVVVKPHKLFFHKPFCFSMFIANICRAFFEKKSNATIKIKWPNDIYYYDRKAGGILIENIFKGMEWTWAVVGIGININQIQFEQDLSKATSLQLITSKEHNVIDLSKELHTILLKCIQDIANIGMNKLINNYNIFLYKKEEEVILKKGNINFKTVIKAVNEYGELQTKDELERNFSVGEVEWIKDS